jgi:hypothetical protein
MCGLACVLVAATGAYGYVVSAPVTLPAPGTSMTGSAWGSGSLEVEGSGASYTYDTPNHVWVSQGFTITSQVLSLSLPPEAIGGGGGGGGGAMLIEIEPQYLSSLTLKSVNVPIAIADPQIGSTLGSIVVNLDGGGTTTIDLTGSATLLPMTWGFSGSVAGSGGPPTWALDHTASMTGGFKLDVSAASGLMPLGYLFQATQTGTVSAPADMSMTLSPSGGPWYVKNVGVAASFFDNAPFTLSTSGTLSKNTYSGSQYPYYAITLSYDSFFDVFTDVSLSMNGSVTIPEPTTLALLVLGPAALWLRRRL